MENSWQRECGTVWQSTPVVSSSQVPQNEILNAGYHFRPCISKSMSSVHRMAPESLLPWISSTSSYNSDHAELGSSLSPLLSGTQSVTPTEALNSSCNISGGFTVGNEFPVLTSVIISQNLSRQSIEAGSDFCSGLSSKDRIRANHVSKSGPSNLLHEAYIDNEKSELLKANMHQNPFSNENEVGFPSLSVGYVNHSIPSNAWKISNGPNSGALRKPDPPASCLSSSVRTGPPRVFCLNLCGDLLLNNTGLLGVVCSCHGIHMSIAKFSEHSGLCNMNPGFAVRVDSGETIAQWRKTCFLKYGIKIPEDHCGWDWPEGFSVTAGPMECCSTVPDVSKNLDHCNRNGSTASVQSCDLQNRTLYSTNAHRVHRGIDQFSYDEKHRNAKECVEISTRSSMHSVAKNHGLTSSTSEGSRTPSMVGLKGPDKIFHHQPPHIPPISKNTDPFVLHTHLQNLEALGKPVHRDIVSSNVELRLGQPSQQGQSSGSSSQLAVGSLLIGTHERPRSTFFSQQHVPRSHPKSVEDGRQLHYMDNCLCSSNRRTEQDQLNRISHIFGASSAVPHPFQIEQFKANPADGSLISRSAPQLNYPLEGRMHSKSTNDGINGSCVMISRVPSEYPIVKPGQFVSPLVGGEASQMGFSSNSPGSQKHENPGNGPSSIDSLQGTAGLSFGSHSNLKGRIWSLNGGESGTEYKVYAAEKDESTTLCHISRGMTEEPVRGNTSNCFGQALYPVQNGELIFRGSRSLNTSMDFRKVFPNEVVPIKLSAMGSLGNHRLPLFSKEEGIDGIPNVMERNARISTMQHTSELANKCPTTFKAILEEDIRNFCENSQANIFSSASDKRINEINCVSTLKTSDVARQSFLSSDMTKLPSVTEEVCNFSVPSQGRLSLGSAEGKYQFASDMHPTGQLFLRLGGPESLSPSSKVGNSSQEMAAGSLPSKCSFTLQTNTGMCDKNGETILPVCNDQERNSRNMMPTFAKKVDTLDPNENMKQDAKKAEVNSFLWRDVPRKVLEDSSVACVENSSNSYNGNVECKAQKCVDDTNNKVGSSKEQEMSNVSSGCSAPVVTQVSIDVNNKESSSSDDARYEGHAIVDEGSRIEKCWSSDDGVDSDRNAKCSVFVSKLQLGRKRSSKPFLSKPKCSLIDELRLRDSLRLNIQKQSLTSTRNQQSCTAVQKYDRDYKIWKRRPVKWKKLTSSFSPSFESVLHNGTSEFAGNADLLSPSVKDMEMLSQCEQGKSEACLCSMELNIKRKSMVSSSTDITLDRDVFVIHHFEEEKTDRGLNSNCESDNLEAMGRKRLRLGGASQASEQSHVQRSNYVDMEAAVKKTAVSFHTCSNAWSITQRPVVDGKYGIIANSLKPAKIVSLRELLKSPNKCRSANTTKLDLSPVKSLKKGTIKEKNGSFSNGTKSKDDKNSDLNPQHFVDETKTADCTGSEEFDNLSHVTKRRRCHRNKIETDADGCQIVELRCKYKEIRKRSLQELTTKENCSSYVKFPILKNEVATSQMKRIVPCKFADEADETCVAELCSAKLPLKDDKYQCTLDLDVLCCVCGSSTNDENNYLLECSGCLIKVHQACYGISRVPKSHWYCRPCKTNAKNIVCVLCGYGGGAMTQALHSRNTVKSLLQAWNIIAESNSKNPLGDDDPFLVIRPVHKGLTSFALCNKKFPQHKDSLNISSHASASVECNSITAGVLNSRVKQWVHMVCGLWTPETRCPNVDTMSSFDVSGVCTAESEVVCSLCERPGGSCIRCRVVGCNIPFHPWCAHQKGMLQSEVEGDYDESIGFYGRCLLHAMDNHFKPDSYRLDSGDTDDGQKKSCARTEGYKGRKRDGVRYNLPPKSIGGGGSPYVPQEQLDAWIHINRQKPCKRGAQKVSSSQIEHDCRKEYARYKQSRGWEHLVVYKSGIHGLGLYTSQFIYRGAMVVEYVGEIVGLRVADKRETEYQSGKKLQYKSACYFFKIDKEYIIDATCKGGIARFVNHSCQPNCVAEIISVRNEKKVVFFAERDIYPGEEITYDYHFNHEDEGKKIPCYCNSKNCRRYLN